MIDFILGLFLAGLLVRGWLRGFVREGLDLVGLVVGLWIAFRLSGPLGVFLTDRFGVTPEVATIGAGVALFLLFGIAMSIAAHYLSKVMNLPGLTLINRLGGAVVASAWGIAIVLVIVNVARSLPFPESLDQRLEDSTVARAIAGPGAVPQQAFESFGTDGILGSLGSIRALFGSNRAVPEGDEALEFPPARPDEVRQLREETIGIADQVNEYRTGQGLAALGESSGLAGVAEKRAVEMYTAGRFSRNHPPGGSVADDLAAFGIRLARFGENLALASSSRAAVDAMLESPTALAQLNTAGYDRIGVSVVDGPTGRLVVIVFGG
jgi:uncharacterized protein YkwD